MKRSVLLLVMLLFGAFLQGQQSQAPGGQDPPPGQQPEAVVAQEMFNAGDILKGKRVEHAFIIRNAGTAELVINSARPG
jgi:hypothetical protein